MALGVAAAAGSFGQFAMLPLTQWLLSNLGWRGALLTMAAVGLAMIPLALGTVERKAAHAAHAHRQSAGEAIREALGHRGYVLLTTGFFVCGFQVVFVGVHLPAYLADRGFAPHVAVISLALVGLFNIVGTYTTGWLGGRIPKRWILSGIYFGRAVVIALFILLPMSLWTIYGFAVLLGLLWLSTVPPTNGIVAGVFGVRYLAMLSGFTFFSHRQIGSFLDSLARRLPLRSYRQLRHRVVHLDRARHHRRAPQPPDRVDRSGRRPPLDQAVGSRKASKASARGPWKNQSRRRLPGEKPGRGKPRAKACRLFSGTRPRARCAAGPCGPLCPSADAGTAHGPKYSGKSSGFARDFPHFGFYVRQSAA